MSLGSCQEMNVSEMFSLARTPLIRSHPHTPVTHFDHMPVVNPW